MGSFSIWHWLILVLMTVVWVIPFWRIFPRAGWAAPLSLLMLLPVVNVVLLWVLAFKTWPQDRTQA